MKFMMVINCGADVLPSNQGKGAAPALLPSRAAISIIANTCVHLTCFNTELKRLCRDFPHLSFSFSIFLVYSSTEEVDPRFGVLFETNHLEDI